MKKLLVLFIAFFAMAGVALADSWTYLGNEDFSGGGVSGPGIVAAAQTSDGIAGSLTPTGATQLLVSTDQQGIIFNGSGSGDFHNDSGVDLYAHESPGNCEVGSETYNNTTLGNSGLGLTAVSNRVAADGAAGNISGGNTDISAHSQIDGEVLAVGGWGDGDGVTYTSGNASNNGGGAQVNLVTYTSTTAQAVGPATVSINAVTEIAGFAAL